MATIRKRVLPSGKTVWQADYVDAGGKRRHKQFATKKEADAFLVRARSEVATGAHVPDREARSVQDAYDLLLTALEADGAARSTIENYRTYYTLHVKPFLGARPLPRIQPADVADFLDRLKAEGRTDDTRRRARNVLGAIFDEAIRRRMAFSNPVRSLRTRRRTRRAEIREQQEKTIVIPERDQVRAMLTLASQSEAMWLYGWRLTEGGQREMVGIERTSPDKPRQQLREFCARHPGAQAEVFRPAPWLRPMLATLALAGLRIGEARGLSWLQVQPEALEVRAAVDRFNERDTVKTVAGLRHIPIGPQLATMLAAWKDETAGKDALVFPSRAGTPIDYQNIANRQVAPLQIVLGITDQDGSPRFTPHSLRHFAVSLWIDEGADVKQVAEWAGHQSPAFTLSTYAHLFAARRKDRTAATAGEKSVLGTPADATRAQHANDNGGNSEAISIA